MTALFQLGNYTGASGRPLFWKIECDRLTPKDWECIAAVVGPALPKFRDVIGVPKGGAPFAHALKRYAVGVNVIGLPTLIADDVWTTGKSMCDFAVNELGLRRTNEWNGVVAFSRVPFLPENVQCFMKVDRLE